MANDMTEQEPQDSSENTKQSQEFGGSQPFQFESAGGSSSNFNQLDARLGGGAQRMPGGVGGFPTVSGEQPKGGHKPHWGRRIALGAAGLLTAAGIGYGIDRGMNSGGDEDPNKSVAVDATPVQEPTKTPTVEATPIAVPTEVKPVATPTVTVSPEVNLSPEVQQLITSLDDIKVLTQEQKDAVRSSFSRDWSLVASETSDLKKSSPYLGLYSSLKANYNATHDSKERELMNQIEDMIRVKFSRVYASLKDGGTFISPDTR